MNEIYVKVPKELTEYEEKPIFGLTLRQFGFGILMAITGVGSYYLTSGLIGKQLASYLSMMLVVPLCACGFVKIQEMYFDEYAKLMFYYYFRKQILMHDNEGDWKIEKGGQNVSRKEKRKNRKINKQIKENQE